VVDSVGTAVEHHTLYQYQLSKTQNIFAGQIQTETPCKSHNELQSDQVLTGPPDYQPNPPFPIPFKPNADYSDPTSGSTDPLSPASPSTTTTDAFGLRIVKSKATNIYGAGLYSFFDNYSTVCSQTQNENCQGEAADVEKSRGITVYNLNFIGSPYALLQDGDLVAAYVNNRNEFPACVAIYKTD